MGRASASALFLLGVVVAERWVMNVLIIESDQLPSHAAPVAAVAGVTQESADRVIAKKLKKVRAFDRTEQLHALRGSEFRNALRAREQ